MLIGSEMVRLSCVLVQVFAVLGFVVSAVLISAAASEVVSILRMLGVVLSLSNTVLGLTLLAWGNSIGGDKSISRGKTQRLMHILLG